MPTQRPTGGGGVSLSIARRPARTFVLIFMTFSVLFWVFEGADIPPPHVNQTGSTRPPPPPPPAPTQRLTGGI